MSTVQAAAKNLCNLIDQYAEQDSTSAIQVFLGVSITDIKDASDELRAALAAQSSTDQQG